MQKHISNGQSPSDDETRCLKIEAVGDFWKGKTKPKIRLTGRWLERAGFKPGHYVNVTRTRRGILELRFVERVNVGCATVTI